MLSNHDQMASIKCFPQQMKNNEVKLEETKPNSFTSTDSTIDPNINSKIKKQKYIFKNDKKIYSVLLILIDEKIKIIVYPMNIGKDEYFYEKDFSQEELKENNKVFKLCNDIEDSYEYLNDLFEDKENQLIVNETNDYFKIEKKMKLPLPLKIEINKKYKNNKNNFNQNYINNINNNNDINNKNNNIKDRYLKNISPLNNNNEIKDKIDILEQANDQIINLVKKKFMQNEERINKLSQNMSILDNVVDYVNEKKKEENKKQVGNLLNKKRASISDLSDISFNSYSNENEFNIKKNKNSLAKETFLKIFSENNSFNSGDSNEKFFMKILKKKKLEEEINHFEKNKNNCLNENNNIILTNKKDEMENETYLYGEQDSSDEIKDDIDFFSNYYSPSIKTVGPNNNINNDLSFHLYNNEKNISQINLNPNENKFTNAHSLFYKNSNNSSNISISSNYKNCIINLEKIQIKEENENYIKKGDNSDDSIKNEKSSLWSVNDSYNMIGSVFGRDSYSKKNKQKKDYKIIHKDSVESCNMDISFKGKNQSINIFSVDSKILSNYAELDFIINYLKIKFKKEIINAIRIYRATEDGDKADDFHRLCDGNTNIIVLIKTKDGKKFGGYTSVGFNNYNQSILDDNAFIFSIDKREVYPNIKGKNAIESYSNLGPTFSGDIIKIYDNFLLNGGITSKNGTNFQTNKDFQINDGKKSFSIEEIEVLEFLEMKIDNNI